MYLFLSPIFLHAPMLDFIIQEFGAFSYAEYERESEHRAERILAR